MVAGGSSTSLDAPQQAAPTHPFAVQAITNPLPPPIIHIDESRHPACIAWINANNMESKTQLAPSTPARTQGATPQINEVLPSLPYLITSPHLLRCADENALLERAAGIFECALESQYSSAQRGRPTPTLQASGPHSTPFAASTVCTSQAAPSQWNEAVSGLFTMGNCALGTATDDLSQRLASGEDFTHESPNVTEAYASIGYSTLLQSVVGYRLSGFGICDKAASMQYSCAQTLHGAILHTHRPTDEGRVRVGNKGETLLSLGSYLYLLERTGKNQVTELVLRRMMHTPKLSVQYAFSESIETHTHGYRFAHESNGKFMATDRNVGIELNVTSDRAQLGWLTVSPVTSGSEQRRRLHTICHMEPTPQLLPFETSCSKANVEPQHESGGAVHTIGQPAENATIC